MFLPAKEPITDPQPQQIDRNNLQENRTAIAILETELQCDESFSQIIKKQEEEEEEEDVVVTICDACSTNCTVFALEIHPSTDEEVKSGNQENNNNEEVVVIFNACFAVFALNYERKRIRSPSTDEEEEEDGNGTKAASDATKLHRINGQKEHDGQNGNQENNNGETEEVAEEETGEGENHEHEEHRENAGGEEDNNKNSNHQNSEQNDLTGNQESGGDDDDDGDEENRENKDEEEDEEERKAAAKGKRKAGEIDEEEEVEDDYYENNDNLDLAILRSLCDYKCRNMHGLPPPDSVKLHFHIKDSVPNLKLQRDELEKKIISFEENFYIVRELDKDNPDTLQPIDQEIYDLCKRLWGNSEGKRSRGPSTSTGRGTLTFL